MIRVTFYAMSYKLRVTFISRVTFYTISYKLRVTCILRASSYTTSYKSRVTCILRVRYYVKSYELNALYDLNLTSSMSYSRAPTKRGGVGIQ